jgi:lysophospholipase L1-like esterase
MPHPRVIVCLGDSTTAGTPLFKSPVESPPDGEGDERSQPAYWIRRERPSWTVLNRGVNGERTDQIAARWERDVLAHGPDVVSILAGVNDVYQGRSAAEVIAELDRMYARATTAGLKLVVATIVPYNTATPDQNARMHEINAWIAGTARVRRYGFADTSTAAAHPENPDRLLSSPDELHPDIEGYRRMAMVLVSAIDGVFRQNPERKS